MVYKIFFFFSAVVNVLLDNCVHPVYIYIYVNKYLESIPKISR